MTDTVIADCATGSVKQRPLTEAETAQRAIDQPTFAALDAAAATGARNRDTLFARAAAARQNLLDAAAALDANTATVAQQRAALALCCRTTAALVRIAANDLDQTD